STFSVTSVASSEACAIASADTSFMAIYSGLRIEVGGEGGTTFRVLPVELVFASACFKFSRDFVAIDAQRWWPGGCNVAGKGTSGSSCKVRALQPARSRLSLLLRASVRRHEWHKLKRNF